MVVLELMQHHNLLMIFFALVNVQDFFVHFEDQSFQNFVERELLSLRS